jgi:hypothetical protein
MESNYSLFELEHLDGSNRSEEEVLRRTNHLFPFDTTLIAYKTTHPTVGGVVFSAVRPPRLYKQENFQLSGNLCGGGVEYLHRVPASRRRRRKGKSRI